VVAVTVSTRWGDEHGEPVEEFEGRELEHGLAADTGLWQSVDQPLALARPRTKRSLAKTGRAQ